MEIHPEGDDLHSWRELECRKLHSVTAVGFCAVFTSLFFYILVANTTHIFRTEVNKNHIHLVCCVVRARSKENIYHIFASFNSQKSLRTTEIKQLSRVKVHYLRVQLLGTENNTSPRHLSLSLALSFSSLVHWNANTLG
jgi:hypothetical protein